MIALGIFILSVAAVYLRPEYAICESRIWTVVAFCGVFVLSKVIYQLLLYPQLFSPLRHIQTPPVSNVDSHYTPCQEFWQRLKCTRRETGSPAIRSLFWWKLRMH